MDEPVTYIVPEGYSLIGLTVHMGLTCKRCGLLVGDVVTHNAYHIAEDYAGS